MHYALKPELELYIELVVEIAVVTGKLNYLQLTQYKTKYVNSSSSNLLQTCYFLQLLK